MPEPDEHVHATPEHIARLESDLESARHQAEEWRQIAEERRATLERIRQHPLMRVAYPVAMRLLPVARRLRRAAEAARSRLRRSRRRLSAIRALPAQLSAPARQRRLGVALERLARPPADPRPVSVVILTRDGHERLADLLPALRATHHDIFEIIVVDNDSEAGTRRFLDAQTDLDVVRLEEPQSFSAANNAGLEAAHGEVVCLLNDDVLPAHPTWLGHLLAALDDGVVAVGAQLVYPRRGLFTSRMPDLTVQHRGIRFESVPGRVPSATNDRGGMPDPTGGPRAVPAVTAACLVARRSDLLAVGGFDERYDFGAEDVDLCWRFRDRGSICVVPAAVCYHDEGATRHTADPAVLNRRQQANWDAFARKLGPALRRAVELDRIDGDLELTDRPYTVALTVTRNLDEAGYGDLHTARELGTALRRLGWRVRLIEKYQDAWYALDRDLDAVVALLDTFDLRRVSRPGLTTVAWVRNWERRWTDHPWFEDYDLVFASSRQAADVIADRTRHRPGVMPLATNPDRFQAGQGPRHGVVLPVNHWGQDRGVIPLLKAVPDLELYGSGWDQVPGVREHWHGELPYDQLPALYGRAQIVVDVAASHTREHGSLNARVFDALAAGALAVTDQRAGAEEIFGAALPTYQGPGELRALLDRWRGDEEHRRRRVDELRSIVLAEHTYPDRARSIRAGIRRQVEKPSFAVLTGAPDAEAAPRWGDTHFAEALSRELRARGHRVVVASRDRWESGVVRAHDVVVQLRGRGRTTPADGQTHVLWVISHPDEVTNQECDQADLILVASEKFAGELERRTETPVYTMLQATDERRFRPLSLDPRFDHEVAFIGNSRFTLRPVVADAIEAGLEPAIYGANWERFVDRRFIAGEFIPNRELPRAYSTVRVLLNDHWESMREWGFVSNRLFDALACGGCVVSDEIVGLEGLFDGAVATYRGPADLGRTVERLLEAPHERRERGERGRESVLSGHTFAHRAEQLLDLLEAHAGERVSERLSSDELRHG